MGRDPQVLFTEAWNFAAKRVNAGRRNKDRIRFYLIDGTTKTFDIPPMQNDNMKDEFLGITLAAINNYPIEALLLTYEAWYLVPDEKFTEAGIDAYLKNNPRPRDHLNRREGVNFYYEAADGIMFTALAEIVTDKKNKRKLARLSPIAPVKAQGRMSHFFKKAREYSKDYKSTLDNIFGGS